MAKSSIVANFLYNSAYQLLLIAAPLVTIPYLARVLGATAVGEYAYTYSIANWFVLLGLLGLTRYGSREIASVAHDRTMLSQTFSALWRLQQLATVVALCFFGLVILFSQESQRLLFIIWSIWVLSDFFDVSWFFFGVEDFKLTAIRSSIVKILTIICIFLLVKSPEDLWLYCLITAGGNCAATLALLPFLPKYVDRCKPEKALIRKHFVPCLGLFLPVVATSLYTILDKVIIGLLAPMEQLGYFEYAEKLSRVPLALITALGTIMLPRMSGSLVRGELEKATEYLSRSAQLSIVLAVAFAFGVAAISPEFVPVFFGSDYLPAVPLMALLSLIIPIVALSNVIGVQYLLPLHKDRAFTLSVCVGALVNVTVNLALVPHMLAMGAVIATICAELSVLLVQLAFVRHWVFMRRGAKALLFSVPLGALMYIAVRMAAPLLPAGIFGLIVEIGAGVCVYCLLAGVVGALLHKLRWLE